MSALSKYPAPYKGLMPYAEEDAVFFFGREAEREIITANLISSRFTVLYGPSGVGKSSVLRAGVAHHLQLRGWQNLVRYGAPELAVVVLASWRDDPVAGLRARVQDAVIKALRGQPLATPSLPAAEGKREDVASLSDALQKCAARVDGDLLIILDQFEEYFLYHAPEDGEGSFAVEFPRAVSRPGLRANFLVSIREDALAKLDRFEGHIPKLFDNYLRVEHLDRAAARSAIVKPLAQFNRAHATANQPINIEPALVETVLSQVKTGQVVLGPGGRGVVGVDDAAARIETPYLQLVMTRLWDEELRSGSTTLRLETLRRLGGAERIVRTHLDNTMRALPPSEQESAARVFHFLVTPSGTKIAHTVADLGAYAHVPPAKLERTMEKLASGDVRILRPVAPPPDQPLRDVPLAAPRYEIFHDVLAPAILDWRERYLRQSRAQRLRLVGGAIAIVFFLIIASLLISLQRSRAQLEQKAQEAQSLSQAVLAQPTSELTTQPTFVAMRETAAAVATSSAQVLCPGAPNIRFAASATSITAGDATMLSWDSATNVSEVTIEPDIGAVAAPGARSISPAVTTTYVLTASGCGGAVKKQVTITVRPSTALPVPTASATTVPSPALPYPTLAPATATPYPTLAPASATPIAPGLYVTKLRIDPPLPTGVQTPTFYVTFLNTTGVEQTYSWCVEIWEPADPRKAFGNSTCRPRPIAVGANELDSPGWRVRVGQCMFYRARAIWEDFAKARIPFTQPDGTELWLDFRVCP